MGFSFFVPKQNLKVRRENYVKEFQVEDITMTPCSKFVACLEKLSRNYVLALSDTAKTETLQVASQNDIEFFEGYELTPNYTDSVRKNSIKATKTLYFMLIKLIDILDRLENRATSKDKTVINEIKMNLRVVNNVVLSVYQHLTMTEEVPQLSEADTLTDNFADLLKQAKNLLLDIIQKVLELSSMVIIDYITRQLELIVDKLNNFYFRLNVLN